MVTVVINLQLSIVHLSPAHRGQFPPGGRGQVRPGQWAVMMGAGAGKLEQMLNYNDDSNRPVHCPALFGICLISQLAHLCEQGI